MKTKLQCFFIGLALLAGVDSVVAQPALGIVPTNNQSLLYWPATATDYVLQSSTNLASTNWVFATDAVPSTYGSQTAVTVTNTSAARFFRLMLVPTTTADGMAFIPAGAFTMGDTVDNGSPASNNIPPINVYVSAFYMDVNLVSASQWLAVYDYATNIGYSFAHTGNAQTNNLPLQPVQTVDWYDAVKWSNARSQQAGLTPVYYTDAALTQVFTNGDDGTTVYPNWGMNGYRLPTEAEWEKAARGGLSGQRFPWGDTISESQANYIADPNPTILAAIPTIWGPTLASTRISMLDMCLSQVRWAILRQTVMASTTWRGICLSGVGIGMRVLRIQVAARIWEELIHADLSDR